MCAKIHNIEYIEPLSALTLHGRIIGTRMLRVATVQIVHVQLKRLKSVTKELSHEYS